MPDLSPVAWAALKWLVVCSFIPMLGFRRTLYASVRNLLEPTHRNTAMDFRTKKMHDIYHTVFLLQQKLARDVIPAILEYAELYDCQTSEMRFHHAQQISQHQSPKQLLVCEVPKSVARVLRPVRKILFDIRSHDQGFASDLNGGSWTWFTAEKLSSATQNHGFDGDDILASTPSELREIFRNPIANRHWHSHEVVWRADSEDTTEAAWVSSLKEGDQIAIHAWARYPAWVNSVRAVTVKVYTVAVA